MATAYSQIEPVGFGQGAFGNPTDDDNEFARGFGDPTTLYSEYTHD